MAKRIVISLIGLLIILFFGLINSAKALEINDGGAKFSREKEGKKFYLREIDLLTGNVNYRLNLFFSQENEKVLISAIGLMGGVSGKRFSKRGWYNGGFIGIHLDEKSLYESPSKIQLTDNGVKLAFHTEKGEVILNFISESQSDKLLLEISLPEKMPGVKTVLVAYPGDYKKKYPEQRDRWISTAKREEQHGRKKIIELAKDEPWVYYYDKLNNPEGKPHLSTCALLYNPKEMEKAEVNIGNYAVITTLYHSADTSKIHYVLWEFPGKDHSKCLEYMKKLTVSFD